MNARSPRSMAAAAAAVALPLLSVACATGSDVRDARKALRALPEYQPAPSSSASARLYFLPVSSWMRSRSSGFEDETFHAWDLVIDGRRVSRDAWRYHAGYDAPSPLSRDSTTEISDPYGAWIRQGVPRFVELPPGVYEVEVHWYESRSTWNHRHYIPNVWGPVKVDEHEHSSVVAGPVELEPNEVHLLAPQIDRSRTDSECGCGVKGVRFDLGSRVEGVRTLPGLGSIRPGGPATWGVAVHEASVAIARVLR